MSAQPHRYVTNEEYLALERSGTEKHEYLAGSVYAMAGASARHNRIAGSAYASLYAQLRQRNCTVYPSDMRVKAVQTGMYAYPDITIVCGNEQFEDDTQDSLLNPVIIIEVLSPSTEKVDRGRKFQSYRTMLSLREYILISQDDCRIERFARQSDNTWVYSEAAGHDDVIELSTIQCVLRLADVYEKVTFPAAGEGSEAN
ncbi:MAG TPA: Uma2 family endonuclease [Roseiflexaceae bacterium]|nr:Uma2 family endonuclease [Roseiflexaceae bacterium]